MTSVNTVATVNEFVTARLVLDPAATVRTVDLWQAWRAHAIAAGVRTGSRPDAVRAVCARAGLDRVDGVVHGARLAGDQ